MSFRGRLHINGTSEYSNILKFTMNLHQNVDQQNRPNSVALGGIIAITLEASRSNELLEWMVSPNMTKTGYIHFSRRDGESAMSNIHFRDAFCINYDLHFDANNDNPMIIDITISARVLDFEGNLRITNRWPGDYDDSASTSSDGVVVVPAEEANYTNPEAMAEEAEQVRQEVQERREQVEETIERVEERIENTVKNIEETREQANNLSNDFIGEDIPNPSDLY